MPHTPDRRDESDVPAVTTTAADSSGSAMTRSEQQLLVSTRIEPTEQVVVRKHIVTEEVTVTVTVRREEITVERRPLPAAGDPQRTAPSESEAAFTDRVHELVLHAEVPVVATRVVPVELVRLTTHTVTGTHDITTDLAREQITVDESPAPGRHALPHADPQ